MKRQRRDALKRASARAFEAPDLRERERQRERNERVTLLADVERERKSLEIVASDAKDYRCRGRSGNFRPRDSDLSTRAPRREFQLSFTEYEKIPHRPFALHPIPPTLVRGEHVDFQNPKI